LKRPSLSTTALVLLSINAVLNIRGLPLFSHIGLQALGFYFLAILGFLIPSGFVCAELAARVPTSGGVYAWVRAAFGERLGFLAIWFEWINNVIAFPATLSTIAATILFLIFPNTEQHRFLFYGLMMLVLWSLTALNLCGVKASSRLSSWTAFWGTLIPGGLVIVLGLIWASLGRPIGFLHPASSIFPSLSFSNLSLFVAAMGALSGLQITAFHLKETENPEKTFPRVMGISCGLIIFLSLGAILAMSAVVPPRALNLLSGVMQMYQLFFSSLGLTAILPIFALLLSLGMIGSMSAWMLGPARGLHVAAMGGHLPACFAKLNSVGIPKNILLTQALISTLFATVFIFMPSLKAAFWMLIALTSQFTVMTYLLIFASVIRLQFRDRKRLKNFCIPGGKFGVWSLAGLGLLATATAFVLGVFPPSQLELHVSGKFIGEMLMMDGLIIGFPYLIKRLV